MDINVELFQWSITFLIEKTSSGADTLAWSETLPNRPTRNKSVANNEYMSNKEVAKELLKPIIRKSEKYTYLLDKNTKIYRQYLGC